MKRIKVNILWVVFALLLIAGMAHAVALSKNHLIALGVPPALADLLGGWTAQTGAGAACNTTCGTEKCIIALDADTGVFMTCANASADSCICTN